MIRQPQYKSTTCENCNKTIDVARYLEHNFCSDKCRVTWNRKQNKEHKINVAIQIVSGITGINAMNKLRLLGDRAILAAVSDNGWKWDTKLKNFTSNGIQYGYTGTLMSVSERRIDTPAALVEIDTKDKILSDFHISENDMMDLFTLERGNRIVNVNLYRQSLITYGINPDIKEHGFNAIQRWRKIGLPESTFINQDAKFLIEEMSQTGDSKKVIEHIKDKGIKRVMETYKKSKVGDTTTAQHHKDFITALENNFVPVDLLRLPYSNTTHAENEQGRPLCGATCKGSRKGKMFLWDNKGKPNCTRCQRILKQHKQ